MVSTCPPERISVSKSFLNFIQQRTVKDVPVAVSSLLDATKRLEESLRLWSALQLSEMEVSDVFVAVGNHFHEMLAAFSLYNIDMRYVSLSGTERFRRK